MSVFTYSPNDIAIEVAGFIVTGWNTITVTRNDATKIVRGIRGHNTRAVSLDTSCTISIELLQTSTANDVFGEILTQDRNKQTARVEVVIKDASGRAVIQSRNAYISNFPDIVYGPEILTRTWVIQCLDSNWQVGGNESPLSKLFSNVFS